MKIDKRHYSFRPQVAQVHNGLPGHGQLTCPTRRPLASPCQPVVPEHKWRTVTTRSHCLSAHGGELAGVKLTAEIRRQWRGIHLQAKAYSPQH
jgi:hypothetical protein